MAWQAGGTAQVQKPWLKQGKGKGKGGYEHRPPQTVPDSFVVDETARYRGVVTFWRKFGGYGFIELIQKGLVPGDKVFAHWKNLSSHDRFPYLVQGMEVEFSLGKWTDDKFGSGITLRARDLTLPGGGVIAVQDELDATQKTFVGGQNLRYSGKVKWYDPKKGAGFVVLDEGYDIGAEVPKELRVERSEVNSGNAQPPRLQDLQVEFGIWQTPKGEYKVYNMTLPGGVPITPDVLEHRTPVQGTYGGKVEIWSWRKGWGFVKPDAPALLPPEVASKLLEMASNALQRGKQYDQGQLLYFRKADVQPGIQLEEGDQVLFEVYTDDKGAGAANIRK